MDQWIVILLATHCVLSVIFFLVIKRGGRISNQ